MTSSTSRNCVLKADKTLYGLALTRSNNSAGVEIGDIGQRFDVNCAAPTTGDRILKVNNINVESAGILSVLRVLQTEALKGGEVKLEVSLHGPDKINFEQKRTSVKGEKLIEERESFNQVRNDHHSNQSCTNTGNKQCFEAYGMTVVFDEEVGNVVVSVEKHSITRESGIRKGDTIVQINHEIVMNYPFEKLQDMIQNSPVESIKLYVASRRRLLERMYKGLPILTQYEPISSRKKEEERINVRCNELPKHAALMYFDDSGRTSKTINPHEFPATKHSTYTYRKFKQESKLNPISTAQGWIEYHTLSKQIKHFSGDSSWIKSLSMNDLTDDVFTLRNMDLTIHEVEQNPFSDGKSTTVFNVLSHHRYNANQQNDYVDQKGANELMCVNVNEKAGNDILLNDLVESAARSDNVEYGSGGSVKSSVSKKDDLSDQSNNAHHQQTSSSGINEDSAECSMFRNQCKQQTQQSTTQIDEATDEITSESPPPVIYRAQQDDSEDQTTSEQLTSNEYTSGDQAEMETELAAGSLQTNMLRQFPTINLTDTYERLNNVDQTCVQASEYILVSNSTNETSTETTSDMRKSVEEILFMEKGDVDNFWDAENIQKMKGEAKLIHAKLSAPKSSSLGLVLKSISANTGKLKVLHLVDRISPGLPAHEANIQEGDIIVSVNGQNAEDMSHTEVIDAISSNKANLYFGIKRLFVDVDEKQDECFNERNSPSVERVGDEIDLTISLDKGTCFNIGIRLDSQLVVQYIDANSPAERSGLRVGDKIIEINGESMMFVYDYKTAFNLLKQAQSTGTIRLKMLRSLSRSVPATSGSVATHNEQCAAAAATSSKNCGIVQTYIINEITDCKKLGIKLKERRQPPHLIMEVDESSISFKSGLKANSYVIGVNGVNVVNTSFRRLMELILQFKKTGELILHVMEGKVIDEHNTNIDSDDNLSAENSLINQAFEKQTVSRQTT